MVLSQKFSCTPSLNFIRSIRIYTALQCNHYKALGLTPSATQAEIKSAYYELSKIHHPDKNQGSEKSAKIFRDITAAYEVLGNKHSRHQYDREQLFMRRPGFASPNSTKWDYNDDLERWYYERRRRMSMGRHNQKTANYNFEAWYRGHYGTDSNKFYDAEFDTVRRRHRYPHKEKEIDNLRIVENKIKLIFYSMGILTILVWIKEILFRKK